MDILHWKQGLLRDKYKYWIDSLGNETVTGTFQKSMTHFIALPNYKILDSTKALANDKINVTQMF